jgi:hypothetical protein
MAPGELGLIAAALAERVSDIVKRYAMCPTGFPSSSRRREEASQPRTPAIKSFNGVLSSQLLLDC